MTHRVVIAVLVTDTDETEGAAACNELIFSIIKVDFVYDIGSGVYERTWRVKITKQLLPTLKHAEPMLEEPKCISPNRQAYFRVRAIPVIKSEIVCF